MAKENWCKSCSYNFGEIDTLFTNVIFSQKTKKCVWALLVFNSPNLNQSWNLIAGILPLNTWFSGKSKLIKSTWKKE